MGTILLLLLLLATIMGTFVRPWIGAAAYFLMSAFGPQFIWPWVFDGIPAFKIVAASTILAFLVHMLRKTINADIYKQKINYALLGLWVLVFLSDVFSPFPDTFSAYPPGFIFEIFTILVLMYFVSLPMLNSEQAYKNLFYLIIFIGIYYTYWANWVFLSYQMQHFNGGRLMGPAPGPYEDENKFAVMFVMLLPFFIYGYFYAKKTIIKYGLVVITPLMLHGLFLTGSRGGLLAAGVVILVISRNLKSKAFSILLLMAFAVAVVWQGGAILNRAESTIERNQYLSEDQAIDPRIESWTMGLSIISKYPLLGVGIQKFQIASKTYFPEKHTYVAHNTYIQIATYSGVLAGLLFIYIFMQIRKNYKVYKGNKRLNDFQEYMNHSIFASMVGFYVAAVFLDMMIYVLYYFMVIVAVVHFKQLKLSEEKNKTLSPNI